MTVAQDRSRCDDVTYILLSRHADFLDRRLCEREPKDDI